jgi:hypothetical protein
MQCPDDLPWMIEYRMNGPDEAPRILSALPRRPVRAVGTSGKTDAPIIRPQIPLGANAWRLPGEQDWRPLGALPRHWMPFVNARPSSEKDFRSSSSVLPDPELLEGEQ